MLIPVTVTAELVSGPEDLGPYVLDALVLYGVGCLLVRHDPRRYDGPVPSEAIIAEGLPFARVEGDGGAWWWAASHWLPTGPIQRVYQHRRAPLHYFEEAPGPKVNLRAGADKSLRKPRHIRTTARSAAWTALLDSDACDHLARASGLGGLPSLDLLRACLSCVQHIGPSRVGAGGVRAWHVVEGGPELDAYRLASVRPVPWAGSADEPDTIRRTRPHRPPYYHGDLVPHRVAWAP